MNRFFLISAFLLLTSLTLYGQKIGVVDTHYLLEKMPQYQEAKARFDKQVKTWETEIQEQQKTLNQAKEKLEAERILLIGDALKKEEERIETLEDELRKNIESKFGTNGALQESRQALSKPFQDKIWNAIRQVSEKNSLGIVLDKASGTSVLFLDSKFDYTEKVLALLNESR